MHTVAVDIAIQGDLAKAPASHFHTVVPFHDLLTIWFSYGQTVLRSAFRVLVYPFAFPAYVFTGYPFRTRNPPFLIFKELFDRRCLQHPSPPLYFEKTEKTNAVCTGLEPVTSCVAPNGRIELPQLPIDNFFNQKTYRIERQSTRYGSYDF